MIMFIIIAILYLQLKHTSYYLEYNYILCNVLKIRIIHKNGTIMTITK